MGNLCSKSNTVHGGHQVLGSGPSTTPRSAPAPTPRSVPPRPAPAATKSGAPNPELRNAAAEAAENRLKQAQARGTNPSNPNQGKLAAKVGKPAANTYPPKQDDRLVWD